MWKVCNENCWESTLSHHGPAALNVIKLQTGDQKGYINAYYQGLQNLFVFCLLLFFYFQSTSICIFSTYLAITSLSHGSLTDYRAASSLSPTVIVFKTSEQHCVIMSVCLEMLTFICTLSLEKASNAWHYLLSPLSGNTTTKRFKKGWYLLFRGPLS